MKRYLLILFTLLLTAMSACKSEKTKAPEATDSYSFTDDYGSTQQLPRAPQRVVSASPAITEIIYALGGESILVGRTDFCLYPEECKKVESIGGISNLNIEKILSLEPDLVLSGSMIPKKSVEMVTSMGTPMVCIIEHSNFDGLYENIEKIGQIIGHASQADSLNANLRHRVARVMSTIDTSKIQTRPKVYYVVGYGESGNFTAGGNTFIDDIINMAGGTNIAAEVTGWNYSLESLFSADPDYIILRKEDSATFVNTPPYNELRAVKLGNIIPINSGWMDLQVPRNIEAIEFIHRNLYAELPQ